MRGSSSGSASLVKELVNCRKDPELECGSRHTGWHTSQLCAATRLPALPGITWTGSRHSSLPAWATAVPPKHSTTCSSLRQPLLGQGRGRFCMVKQTSLSLSSYHKWKGLYARTWGDTLSARRAPEGLQAPQAQLTSRSQGRQDWAKPYM